MRLRSSLLLALSVLAACDKTQPAPGVAPSASASGAPLTVASSASSASSGSSSSSAAPAPPPPPSNMNELAKGSNELGFDLYGRIRGNAGNVAMSPASISAALAMTYGGAKGDTAAQMKKTLHFTADPAATMTAWGAATRSLVDPSRPLKLRVANRLFGEKTFTFEQPYLDRTKTAFDAPLEPVDFKTAPDAARTHINGWVEEQTEHRIKDLLPGGAIVPDTRLVLVNAIYFLAGWEKPFDVANTKDAVFHVTAAAQKNVPTMNQTTHLRFAKGKGAQMVELNYKGSANALWIVLPDTVDGLAGIEKNLSAAALDEWKTKLQWENIRLSLPRFEVSPKESLALAKELAALGMPDAFDRKKADFTGIANPPNVQDRLFVGNVFHKAFVKTDEKGTEAAAATAVSMTVGGGAPAEPIEFKVDRPFLFFIVDKPSSLVLFMGRVSDPAAP